MTKGYLAAKKSRNNYLDKYNKTNDPFYHERCKTYRNKINHLIRKSKKNHYNKFFAESANDMKKTWKK